MKKEDAIRHASKLYNPVNMPDPIWKHYGYDQLDNYSQHAATARIGLDRIWLSAKRCACKGLCTLVENKTLLKTVFIWNVVLCTCINEWVYSTDNFSNQAVVDFKIQSSHTEKAPKNGCQKWTSMYRVIFVTLLTNKSQAHGETDTDLYAENIVLYG